MNKKDIIRTLKSERCPPSVLKRVRAAVRSEKSPAAGWGWGIPVGASVVLAVLLSLIFINIPEDSRVGEEIASVHTTPSGDIVVDDYTAEAEKLKFAFTYIGLTLAEETERNRNIILRNTVPVVKDSIENTEKFINNNIWGKKTL